MSIVQENQLPGTPESQWNIDGAENSNIEGFATQMSVNHGQTVQFKIRTAATAFRLDIYRLGYYAGLGARLVTSIHPTSAGIASARSQPNPIVNANYAHDTGSAGLVDAGNWSVVASWDVPQDATSGIYIAKLEREDNVAGSNYIVFVVRNDEGNSNLLLKTADETWQAYNNWGNSSVYGPNAGNIGRSFAVSYNRPLVGQTGTLDVFGAEYSMVRFMESNGYDVSYTTAIDMATRASTLLNHKAIVAAGHQEYWSGSERANIEAARDAGVNLVFLSGNEMFWKTYWSNSIDGANTSGRTLVCYKETHDNAITDPNNPNIWTGTWRDPRFSPPADGGRPENALTGTIFMVNYSGPTDTAITVPAANGKMRFWRNTSIATLAPGTTASLPAYTLSGEWDEDLDNGFRPAGLFDLSSTTVDVPSYLLDNGSTYGPGTATHSLTMYRAASGALVFSSGADEWAYCMDDRANSDPTIPAKDVRMQQATINLFADMGAQPASLQAGLVAATASTDFSPPTSTITSPSQGANEQAGVPITIRGTAQDNGGGVLTSVEVSVDGGLSWNRANGLANWTYSWTPRTSGTVTIKSRAVDDSGNIEQPSAGITVNPPPQGTTTYSLWNSATTPPVDDSGDASAVELGVKFVSDSNASISGLRFYKSAANTGTHTASLWTSSGQLLATATFTNETASGWQQVNFSSPVAITAGTTYVASYHTNSGHYSSTPDYFATQGVDSGPLHALANGVNGGNGVYLYGAGGFPSNTYQSYNYWVDVVLNTASAADTTPPTVTAMSPANGTSNVAISSPATITFSEPMSAASITTSTVFLRDASNVVVPTTVAYNSTTNTATLTPTSPLANSTTYTIVAKGGSAGVKDVAGNALVADVTGSFTTAAPADTTPPTVIGIIPANGTTNVATNATVTVTFSEPMSAASITTSTVFLRDASNVVVPINLAYNSGTNTATLTPTSPLANSASYTIIVKGGSAGVKDLAGNALVADTTSTFVTTAASPVSLWANSATPAIVDSGDGQAVELGTKFTSDVSGYISAARFYKSAANTGTHTASLWTASGQRLATGTFVNETASGWQQVAFSTPVAITAGTTYVISYHTNTGHYSVSRSFFTTQFNSGLLHVPTSGGVYLYGAGGFPANTFQSSNYWVDVVFNAAPTVTAVSPANGMTNVATNPTATITFSAPMNTASVTTSTVFLRNASNVVVPSTIAYNSTTNMVTLTPTSSLANSATYTIVVKGGSAGVKDVAGNALVADVTGSFTTVADTTPPTVTAMSPANGATNVAINTAASVTFSEPMSTASITTSTIFLRNASNVVVTSNLAYNSATNTVTLTPTSPLANSTTYTIVVTGGSAGVKDLAGNALVADVTGSFTTAAPADTTPPTVTAMSPANGTINVAVNSTATVTFSEPMSTSSITTSTVFLRNASNVVVPITLTYNSATNTATLTPTSPLANSATYTIVVKGGSAGVKDLAGNALVADATSTFTAVVLVVAPVSLWTSTATPVIVDSGDGQAVELGTKFTSDASGYISAARFYKSAANTGTHTASLWSASGQRLATGTFVNETASGWQQVAFSTPVAITAGTTYIISYHTNTGHYSVSRSYFTSQFNSGLLHVPTSGGVYLYGAGGFPANTFQSSNYWVDVVFNTAPTVTAVSPANGTTNVATSATATITLSEPMSTASITTSTVFLRNASNVVVPTTVAYNSATNKVTLTPTSALNRSTTYTIVVKGGSAGVKDAAGNALLADFTSVFTTL